MPNNKRYCVTCFELNTKEKPNDFQTEIVL